MYIYRDSGINRVRKYNDGNTMAESVTNYALQANNNREFVGGINIRHFNNARPFWNK